MSVSPQIRLAFGLVTLLISAVFVADLVGLLPRPEEQIRESRKLLGEALAVQLSTAARGGGPALISSTLEEVVSRNETIRFAGLIRSDGTVVASYGEGGSMAPSEQDVSSFDDLVIPIFSNQLRWGEARLQFEPADDWGLRFLGVPQATLYFAIFLAVVCMASFYFFLRKALTELNPTKAVPERVNAAFNVLAEGVMILDESERIVLANQVLADRFGEEAADMIGKSPQSYGWDLRGDEREELPWQTVLRDRSSVTGMPLELSMDDERIIFTVNAAPIEDGHGELKGVLITFDDVTPIEAKNAELARMLEDLSATQKLIEDKNRQLEILATRDPLTGCLNRRSFLSAYEKDYKLAVAGNLPIAVFMVDIDHFKRVNDTYGHSVGDDAIKAVAGVLRAEFENQYPFGRYGGEEFIVATSNTEIDEAAAIGERLRKTVSLIAGTHELPLDMLTVSVGVATREVGDDDPMELIDRADRALYKAKETGRNRVCRFDPGYTPGRAVDAAKSAREDDDRAHGNTTIVHRLQTRLQDIRHVVEEQATEITRKSMHDELTGLPNRFLLQDRLQQAMRLSDRNGNITAVVSISMSAYRGISELLGHDAADDMIRAAAQRIETVVRSIDSIGVAFNEQALTFSRVADNELAMLIVDLDSVESVPKIITRVTDALERPFTVRDNEVVNDVNCGVALYPHDGREPELLVRNASLARSYAERRSPRSDHAYFSRDIDSMAAKNANIAVELRKAIDGGGLEVYYQPKVDAVTRRVSGVEALVRWNHHEFGAVGPTEFITIAENIGVIDQLTDWVLARVCDDIAAGGFEGLRVSVNVSPLELYDLGTADRLIRTINERNVSPRSIEIEITESSILNNFDLARRILVRLQEEGLLVVLDDFGTAYSSLNLLLEIPVDVIKVDRCFVTELQDARDNRAVVRAIIEMARSMGKRVVAEGVQTIKERDCLILLGCREMQGFYYSEALPIDKLRAYITEHGVLDLAELRRPTAQQLEKIA